MFCRSGIRRNGTSERRQLFTIQLKTPEKRRAFVKFLQLQTWSSWFLSSWGNCNRSRRSGIWNFSKQSTRLAKELRAFYSHLRTLQSETAKSKISPETLEKLSKTFVDRQSALLQAFRAPISDKNSLETYFRADFLDTVNTCVFVKKFNALRRIASFENFKPKDFKAEEEKAKNNFNILGLDMDLVKYPKLFMQREKTGKLLQEEVEYFVGEIRSAYKRIGKVTEANFIGALKFLCKSTDDAWICECLDPRSVINV